MYIDSKKNKTSGDDRDADMCTVHTLFNYLVNYIRSLYGVLGCELRYITLKSKVSNISSIIGTSLNFIQLVRGEMYVVEEIESDRWSKIALRSQLSPKIVQRRGT